MNTVPGPLVVDASTQLVVTIYGVERRALDDWALAFPPDSLEAWCVAKSRQIGARRALRNGLR